MLGLQLPLPLLLEIFEERYLRCGDLSESQDSVMLEDWRAAKEREKSSLEQRMR